MYRWESLLRSTSGTLGIANAGEVDHIPLRPCMQFVTTHDLLNLLINF